MPFVKKKQRLKRRRGRLPRGHGDALVSLADFRGSESVA